MKSIRISCRHVPTFFPAGMGQQGTLFDSGIFTNLNLNLNENENGNAKGNTIPKMGNTIPKTRNTHDKWNIIPKTRNTIPNIGNTIPNPNQIHFFQTLRSNFHHELDELDERDELPTNDSFPAETRSSSNSRGESLFLPTLSTGVNVSSADSPAIPVVMTGSDVFWVQLGVSVRNVRCDLSTAQTSLNFGKLFTNTRYEYSIKLLNSVPFTHKSEPERCGGPRAVLAVLQLQYGPNQRRAGAADPAERLQLHEDRAHALRGGELPCRGGWRTAL